MCGPIFNPVSSTATGNSPSMSARSFPVIISWEDASAAWSLMQARFATSKSNLGRRSCQRAKWPFVFAKLRTHFSEPCPVPIKNCVVSSYSAYFNTDQTITIHYGTVVSWSCSAVVSARDDYPTCVVTCSGSSGSYTHFTCTLHAPVSRVYFSQSFGNASIGGNNNFLWDTSTAIRSSAL